MKLTHRQLKKAGIKPRHGFYTTVTFKCDPKRNFKIIYHLNLLGKIISTLFFIPNIFIGGISEACRELKNTWSGASIDSDYISEDRAKRLLEGRKKNED